MAIFSANMPRRLRNWSYKDVTAFLRENGFGFLKELKGSHQAWIKRGIDGERDTVVELNFTHHSYPQGTLKMIIRQSGIEKGEWFKWAGL
jgi:predicted RNA binding protein YcfA (HicA-like mRNA interferase family)